MDAVEPFRSISVIGAGAWGTALAQLCAEAGADTALWAREDTVAAAINNTNENPEFLDGVSLSTRLRATTDIAAAARADAFLFVAPVQYSRPVLAALKQHAASDAPIALCSKGVELETGLLMTEVLEAVWPAARAAVLSGPSFARDVAQGLPTAVTLACPDEALGRRWITTIGAPHFRPYLTTDLIGAELGGAVKNVIAIAAGAVAGRGLGESARAALIARGFAEFQRLGVALGADPQTMVGLSGLGDLILTANSQSSRNMSLGFALGEGRTLKDVLGSRNSVSEGVASAGAVLSLAARAGVDMPICAAVADLVGDRASLDAIIARLLARPFTKESL